MNLNYCKFIKFVNVTYTNNYFASVLLQFLMCDGTLQILLNAEKLSNFFVSKIISLKMNLFFKSTNPKLNCDTGIYF